MKILSMMFLFLLLTVSSAQAMRMHYNGCDYDCHMESQTFTNHSQSVKEVKHSGFTTEMMFVERTSTPVIGPNEVLHDCKDYKEWDNIVAATNSGENTGYKVVQNKLYTNEGKRYLRCNDPANEKWVKRWVEKIEIEIPVEWSEFILIDNITFLTISKWICYPIDRTFFTHGGSGGYHGGGGSSNPVPEPGTMLLFGTGLIGLTFIKKVRS